MRFQLQIDKNSFQFHTICIGMNPLKHDAATRTKEDLESIRNVHIDLDLWRQQGPGMSML
jgi:hypothetical protein